MYQRQLQMDLPEKQSAFLWGARQTGKSHYLHHHFESSIYYDLLEMHELLRLTKQPSLLREEILKQPASKLELPIIIDEIQKVPDLLNEVHWMIENKSLQFILCGSSARKLKTQSINLLGGRAWQYHFYPLSFSEIPNFDLLRALQQGLIPNHYSSKPEHINNHLQAYVDLYLTDEIRNEGLVRNLNGFARFLDVAGLSNTEMINMSNIARDCGASRHTVQEYFQILIDTLLGYFIYPYRKKSKRDIITTMPKFYFFDVAIPNYISQQTINSLKGTNAGRSFEHYILLELITYIHIKRKRVDITYWRTKTGLEVDFVLGDAKVAIEVKISEVVQQSNLKGLVTFCEELNPEKAIVVSQDLKQRKLEINKKCEITIYPWREFLQDLWNEKII